ncbi:Aspartate/methionine/tyrosine aminotransferase [Micromonospora sediminicola]|uniref:Aminotransferase n=1 Tax=Micromonospora sediminicola TaxID=946078 RepID=A0A1A9B9G7_9ACTN|nr:aminotransferase [Micromonospora sediminicola]SBT65716.1 Aspartate/methionine/tyrosine aminotransferase [Micromonospora sediminicola]
MQLRQRTRDQVDSPISSAYALLDLREGNRPLLDLAQAAPQYPTAPTVTEHVVRVAGDPHGGDYTEVPGLPRLRDAIAADLSRDYAAPIHPDQVVVTAGCNQAFSLVASALAGPGDEIVLPLPYYFNHDMWLRLNGIRPVYLEPGPDLVPQAATAGALITERTRAIVLVTPGNPTGVTIGPTVIADFAEVARQHDVALIVDETYRSFRDTDQPAHHLFADPDWARTLVSLHSFSKEFAIPGYRVGAVVAAPELHRQVCKLLDCVAVCAPRIGQEAAWAGLTGARQWRAARAREIADRRAWFSDVMAARPGGFELLSCGGFFGWIRHPFADRHTEDVVRDLVVKQDMLVLPGTAFLPDDRRTLRVSVSNLDRGDMVDLAGRLAAAGGGRSQ